MTEIEFEQLCGCRAVWNGVIELQQLYGDEHQRVMMLDVNATSEPTPFASYQRYNS